MPCCRCFKSWSPAPFAEYHANATAWMNSKIFNEWALKFNRDMKLQKRTAVLLCDNAASHNLNGYERETMHGLELVKLGNLTVVYLPPNTTSIVQPLDQGIIAAWKVAYKRKLLQWTVASFDGSAPDADLSKVLARPREAITWGWEAWQELTPATIRNCWRKARILPVVWNADISSEADKVTAKAAEQAGMGELAELIGKLALGDDALRAEDYVSMAGEQQIEAEWTTEQLVAVAKAGSIEGALAGQAALDAEEDAEEEEEEAAAPLRLVSLQAGRVHAEGFCAFVAQNRTWRAGWRGCTASGPASR